ncbi:M16 family metallopeptidase [Celeribacter sp.]|uniref:M16 family metallopeptidase n=1 Tax=Celeribacter sp. TaxID=1890673 RepID=UPI003A908FAB
MIARFLTLVTATIFATALHAAVDIQEVESEGGISAWLVEEHSIPFTALEIRFRGGTSLDREGKRGEVNLMMALLEEGAGDLDAQEFAKARDNLAASFEFDAYRDSVSISARFLTENRDEAIRLLRAALVETRFDEDAIARVKGQVQSVIRNEQTDPGDIASNAFNAKAFGDHPYGTSDNGTSESVDALTREDMFAARDRAIVRDRIYVSAVGDITANELADLLDGLLGELPETGPKLPERVTPALDGGIEVVPYDTPQSVVIFGHQGISRDHPDYIPAYVANEVVGGAAESRLMEEVREKRGLTYGIGAYLLPFDHSELVLGQFSTANATVAEAIDVVRGEWEKLAADGLTAEELDLAKTYLTGAYALRFDGNAPIARIMVGMQMSGLDSGYIARRNDLVEALTLDEVNRVVREIYDPENLTFVVVGQPEGLETD